MAKEIAIPKSAAACADLLYKTRQTRLDMQKGVEKLQKLETALKDYFINTYSIKDSTGIAGKVARVQVEPKAVPVVEDWDKFYKHLKKTGEFELLQRRLSDTAVVERWGDKKQIPGVGRFNTKTVSCTLIK